MKPVSLADLTYEQGLELLNLRKQALDSGTAARMTPQFLADSYLLRDSGTEMLSQEKQAAPAWMKNLGDAWKNQSLASKSTMIGAGAGAIGGLGKTVMDDEDDSYMGNMLAGGLGGAAVGGAAGLAMDKDTRNNLANKATEVGNNLFGTAETDLAREGGEETSTQQSIRLMSGDENESKQNLLKQRDKTQGFVPGVNDALSGVSLPNGNDLSDYNNAATATAAGASATPTALEIARQARNPSIRADAGKAVFDNQALLNYDDATVRKILQYGNDGPANTGPNGLRANIFDEALGNGSNSPVSKQFKDYFDAPEAGRMNLDDWVNSGRLSPENAEAISTVKDLKEQYRKARGLSASELKELNLSGSQLAAFEKMQEMAKAGDQAGIDKLMKQLELSPGVFSGEAAMKNLKGIASEDILKQAPRRFNPAGLLKDVSAARGLKNKSYQILRAAKNLPKGRAGLLAGTAALGAGTANQLGLWDSAAKATANAKKEREVFENMQQIQRIRQRLAARDGNQ